MPASSCSAQAINGALARYGIFDAMHRPAQVGPHPNCTDGWFADNVIQVGDTSVVLAWRNGGWKLITSSSLSMCKSQLVRQGAPRRVTDGAVNLASTCGTPETTSQFGGPSASSTSLATTPDQDAAASCTIAPGYVTVAITGSCAEGQAAWRYAIAHPEKQRGNGGYVDEPNGATCGRSFQIDGTWGNEPPKSCTNTATGLDVVFHKASPKTS